MVDWLNDAVGAVIGSMVLGGMIVGGALKYIEYRKEKKSEIIPLKANIIDATTYNLELFVILTQINNRFGNNVVKSITAETTNGGGIPKTGYPTYVKMLLENTGPGVDSIIKYWLSPQPITTEYMKMLVEVIKKGVHVWDSKNLEDGDIKDVLEGQKIKKSWVWALGVNRDEKDREKDSFMFLSVDFKHDFIPTPEDKLFMRNQVHSLQTILSMSNSFTSYNLSKIADSL